MASSLACPSIQQPSGISGLLKVGETVGGAIGDENFFWIFDIGLTEGIRASLSFFSGFLMPISLVGVACAVTGPIWGNLVDSGASRKWLLQAGRIENRVLLQ